MKAIFTFVGLVWIVGCVAQNRYFKGADGRTLDEASYTKSKQTLLASLRYKSPGTTLSESFTEISRRQDSLVLSYSWDIHIVAGELENVQLDPLVGKEFPTKNLKTIDGSQITLADLRGKPVLLNFWYVGCEACTREMPVLNDIKKGFGDRIHFIAVTYDRVEKVRPFLKKYPSDFIQVVDAQELVSALRLKEFPKNIILDKDGNIASVSGGIPISLSESGEVKSTDGTQLRFQLLMAEGKSE